ncbi:Reverse transcriptase (RNA-dependent DNA polymerase) [Seminavis robusta]|uniref:Reverse transcriptase (RNA-dependent DNA polymerase) n=1 Tax=Seminavis robusta TaxID=568900 RepID=A0A9N8DMB0_9STRA|nr:Reverse transcriptase (RNA-dependent DNA polymerase) [Seminavis robusta]|eukprot:Sro225_g091730.1 Reverse transcriptase (RNA-dependent DNA polymerase) (318) ;mRNA; f:17852-18875
MKPLAYQLRYPRLNIEMYTDTVYGKVTSLLGNKCAQVYCTPFHWCHVDPMKTKSEAHLTLDSLFQKIGVPRVLIPDNAKELTMGEFRRKAQRVQCPIHPVEAYTPNQNFAEDLIRELKRTYRRTMTTTDSLECLWDMCFIFCGLTRSHAALLIRELDGQVPATLLTGDTADISHICEFGWYDWVWYLSPERQGESMERKRLGRYCGPSTDIGDAMCARILTEKGQLVSRTSVIPLSDQEKLSPVIESKKAAFTESLKKSLGKRYVLASSDDAESRQDEEIPEYYEPIDDRDPAPLPELETKCLMAQSPGARGTQMEN